MERMTREEFEKLVEAAVERIPDEFRRAMQNVAIVIHDRPGPEAKRRGLRGRLYGLYRGVPMPQKSVDEVSLGPDMIYLYQKPLEEDFPRREDLIREVEITVAHEIAHHFGFDDDTLHRYGYD